MAGGALTTVGPGTVVAGTYEVTGLLGRGGMGAVWAARHLRLPGKQVAIKVLLGSGVGEQALARFRREAEIASRIGHPNIVEVLDFNTLDDGTPYQVLEFLDGESLGQRLRRGSIALDETVELVLQIGSALRAAHRAGVVHRDLKPDNIFLCPSDAGGVVHDRVKILDFGISKIRGSQTLQTQESVLIGTPQYMSPEQASGKNQEVDQRTDVFALGAIVYEMLSGRPAFSGDSIVAVILDVVQGIPTPLASLMPSLPIEVDRAVSRALAKRADERFAEIGDFVTALTGRTLQTLDNAARGTTRGAVSPATSPSGARRPLSSEDMVGETMAPPVAAPASGGRTAVMPAPAPASPATVRASPGAGAPVAGANANAVGLAAPAGPAKSRAGVFLGIGVAALALIAAGVWLPRRQRDDRARAARAARVAADDRSGSPTAAVNGAAASASPAQPPVAAAVAVEPPKDPAGSPAGAGGSAAGVMTSSAATKTKKGAPRGEHGAAVEAIPADVAAQLAEAERLLDAGDAGEAIRRTRQSFFTLKTDRGWGLLARAFCAKGDLENAKASLRNVRAAAPDRARAAHACHARGIDLR
jgi:hypothetical protein